MHTIELHTKIARKDLPTARRRINRILRHSRFDSDASTILPMVSNVTLACLAIPVVLWHAPLIFLDERCRELLPTFLHLRRSPNAAQSGHGMQFFIGANEQRLVSDGGCGDQPVARVSVNDDTAFGQSGNRGSQRKYVQPQ